MHRRTLGSLSAPSTHGRYAQAVSVRNATEWVHISGQVGSTVDGVVPETFEEQCRLAWRNLGAQLAEAGMSFNDLVKATVIITDRANIDGFRAIRKEMLGDQQVAMTAIVAGLFDDRWLVEIEGIAAR